MIVYNKLFQETKINVNVKRVRGHHSTPIIKSEHKTYLRKQTCY